MDKNSREFGLFIDGLRIDRNMSREDLCDGIMSLSQYKRYLRGESSIPNNKLVLIADKLKFTIDEIHKIFQERNNIQLIKIDNIYNLSRNRKYDEAYSEALKIRNKVFISEFNQLFFDFCFIHIQHKLNLVSNIHVLDLYSKMINYPDCQKNESFNWVELNILFEMIQVSLKVKNYEPAEFVYKLLNEKKYNFSVARDNRLMPNIFLVLGQTFGIQKKYKEVINITQKGIEHCLNHQTSFAIASLFSVNSLAHLALNEKKEAINSAKKALMQLYIEGNDKKIDEYKLRLSKAFNEDIDEIFKL
jgi:transcriptional regulator with XRE-family HTH domain